MAAKEQQYGQLTQCSCSMIRKAARKITQYYDDAMREAGIRSTQFYILSVLASKKAVPLIKLAEAVGIERTGLTRNLNVLERNGWVLIHVGVEDSRQRVVSLSDLGREQLDFAIPYWKKAQNKIKHEMGDSVMAGLRKTLSKINSISEK